MFKNKHIKIFILFWVFVLLLSNNIHANNSLDLNSKAAILIDDDSGKILYEKGGNAKVYPASTTKVLTAILTLENLKLDDVTVVTKNAINLPYGSSNAALKQGEVMTIRDLLYSLMLKSGNDSANVLAEAVSGSIENFVDLMNAKLNELGCTNSHFSNAHGYHDDNHYTTPNDMMKILSYAIKNEEFVKIFSTPSYIIESTNKTENQREYQNTNRLILTKEDSYLSRYYEYCIGGKTGYTDEAGKTLIAYAKKDNKNLILGVFNAESSSSLDTRYTDAINLFEYGFNNFEKKELLRKEEFSFSYTNKENSLIYKYSIPTDIIALSSLNDTNEYALIDYDINLDYNTLNKYDITSTDYKNQVIGSIQMSFRQNSINYDKEFDLILNDITELKRSPNFTNIIIKLVCVILVVYVLLLLLKISNNISKKRKRTKCKKGYRNNINNIEFKNRRIRR